MCGVSKHTVHLEIEVREGDGLVDALAELLVVLKRIDEKLIGPVDHNRNPLLERKQITVGSKLPDAITNKLKGNLK
jgi:hypothetical protein